MPVGWRFGRGFGASEHDSPLAIVWQRNTAKGFSRLAGILVAGVGEVPATLFEGVAGLFQPF